MKKTCPICISIILLLLFQTAYLRAQKNAPLTPFGTGPQHPMKFDPVFDLESPARQSFLQDSDGFLWIGSDGGGIFRYDGYNLKNYGTAPGVLLSGIIYRIIEDAKNPDFFWIATKNGLHKFDRTTATFTYYTHDPDNPQSINSNYVTDIVQDGTDADLLWVNTAKGLHQFDKKTERFIRCQHDQCREGSRLACELHRTIEDREDPNILWLAWWGGGLDRFEKDTQTFTHYPHDPDNPESLGAEDNIITAIVQDKDNPDIIWIGTLKNGLDKFHKKSGSFTHYRHNPKDTNSLPADFIALIYDDGYGTLWIGGWSVSRGLTLFDKKTETFVTYKQDPDVPYSLRSDLITNVFEDRSGIFWIATYSGKVDKYDKNNRNFHLYQKIRANPNSLNNNSVTTLYEDQNGLIWLGTQAGLARFDRQTNVFTNYTSDPNDPFSLDKDYIYDIFQDSSGGFWVLAWHAPLIKFDTETGRVVKRYNTRLKSFTQMIEDPQNPGILWLTSKGDAGFVRLDKKSGVFKFYPADPKNPPGGPNKNFLYVILHDNADDFIWLGGREGGGLNKFDKHKQTFTHYIHNPANPQSLSNDDISDIYQDATQTLWIGTLGGGLDRFDKNSEIFTHYGNKHGVPSDIYAILQDGDGKLWLSTNRGIVKFDPATGTIAKCYDRSDGLQGDLFLRGSSLKTADGEMWFGGTNGVNRFHPDKLAINPYKPPIVLTALTQGSEPLNGDNNKTAPHIKTITLDWKHNYFEFEFAALNFTNPFKNQYKYMLEGLDHEWYDAGTKRTGRYSGIPDGTYTLRIIGSNNDGVWNEAGVSVKIIVTAPWWKTIWFIGSMLFLLMGLAYSGYRFQVSTIDKRRRELEILVKKRTGELMEANDRFATVMNSMEAVIYVADMQTYELLFINDYTRRLFGDVEGKICWQALQAKQKGPCAFCTNKHLVATGGEPTGIYNWEFQNSITGYWYYIQDRAIRWIDGRLVRMEIATDITRLKQIEIKYKLAKDAAESANRAKSAFLANMSHELRTPLNAILGFARMMARSRAMPREYRENIAIINRNGEHLLTLINQVLDLSKIEAGHITLNERNFDFYNMLSELEDMFRMQANSKRLQLVFNRSEAIPRYIRADEVRLRQVLINLLGNALKFTKEGGVELRIKIQKSKSLPQSSNLCLQFEIKDTGPGIASEELDKLFEAFAQTAAGRQAHEGTGLGLPISKKFVQLMGGEITARSEPGCGTRFIFDIQAGIADAAEIETAPAPKTGQGPAIGKSFETISVRNNGGRFPVEVSISALKMNDKWHAVGIVRDITEKKKMLEENIRIQKFESLGILAGGVAHDVNNLLTVILGNINLAESEINPEIGVSQYLKTAEQACLKTKELTSQFITLSKGSEPVKHFGSIEEVLKETATHVLSNSDMLYDLFLQNDLWQAEFDKNQIKQAFGNIMINAAESMPDGGSIVIKAKNVRADSETPGSNTPFDNRNYVKIIIRDSGVGISEKNMIRIFDPYFSTKARGAQKGMGLGLTIAWSVITQHGGRLTVESEVGSGTVASIYLPALKKNDEAQQNRNNLTDMLGAEEKAAIYTGKILLMDDEAMIRDLAKEMLRRNGYDAELACDGAEAIELYQKALASGNPFDVVILDLTIKAGMGGRKTVQALLEIDPLVKAIVSSGYSDNPVLSDPQKYGFTGSLRKPYSMKNLTETLAALLK